MNERMIHERTARICVVGLGYIGLPTACFFAKAGFRVYGCDIIEEKVALLQNGQLPFCEPGLEELLAEGLQRISFSREIQVADIYIICVPTPLTIEKKSDLSYLVAAVQNIQTVIKKDDLIVVESTIPPRTIEDIVKPLFHEEVFLAHAPERAIPGNTIIEIVHNTRIVGGVDGESRHLARILYETFVKSEVYETEVRVAEIVKIIENTYRDVNIGFANEIAKICERMELNVWDVIRLANFHPRVSIHLPGPGVGGHCIPIDPYFLLNDTLPDGMIAAARLINNSMPQHVVFTLDNLLRGIENPLVSVLGIAYKKNVSDDRESPSLQIIELLKLRSIRMEIFDPLCQTTQRYCLSNSFKEATEGSDCILLLTDHDLFREIDPSQIGVMRTKLLYDTRNVLNHDQWRAHGFQINVLGSA